MLIYSADPAADRAFLRDVLSFSFVDAHEGWLIFGLPPAELGVHPAETASGQAAEPTPTADPHAGLLPAALYLMCDDISACVAELRAKGVECSEPSDQGWGILSMMSLPSGGRLGVYQPRHPLAIKP